MLRVFKVNASLILVLLSAAYLDQIYSQEHFADSVVTGKTYRFIMYNESEIYGTVLSSGQEYIKILTESGSHVMVNVKNILFFSPYDLSGRLKYSVSLLGGISMLSSNGNYGVEPGMNIDLAGIYYFDESKAIKADFGYTFIKEKHDDYITAPLIYPYYPDIYEGGDISYFTLKGNYLLGMFNPEKKLMFYGSIGFGFNVTHVAEINEQYYNYDDSLYMRRSIPAENNINAVISAGGGLVFKVSKKLSVHTEIEYNYVTTDDNPGFFYSSRSYIPLRLGIMYSIH